MVEQVLLDLPTMVLPSDETSKYFIFRQPLIHSYGNYKPNTYYAGVSFIDKAIDQIEKGIKVNVFYNIERCFVKVDQLADCYLTLLENNNYGIYNIGSNISSYFERIKTLCQLKKIKYEKLLNPIKGNVFPIRQKIDTSKFCEKFNIIFD